MLTTSRIEHILTALPNRAIGLVGDLFLDRYLDIDASLNEPSIETGLTAYQVARVRSYPGALGTVLNNLCALGVGRVLPVSIIGDDGEGYELLQALRQKPNVELAGIITTPSRRTPTYCKPMLCEQGKMTELNRLDTKNRLPLDPELIQAVCERISAMFQQCDGVIVLDQVSEVDCGVIHSAVRDWLMQLAQRQPEKFVLADSREQIEKFRHMCVKPNESECAKASARLGDDGAQSTPEAGDSERLFREVGRTVYKTAGAAGVVVTEAGVGGSVESKLVRADAVEGPIDICGAGDSCSAGIMSALVAGANAIESAAFGNLVASITVQQIGTTGTATPEQVRQRWREVSAS